MRAGGVGYGGELEGPNAAGGGREVVGGGDVVPLEGSRFCDEVRGGVANGEIVGGDHGEHVHGTGSIHELVGGEEKDANVDCGFGGHF